MERNPHGDHLFEIFGLSGVIPTVLLMPNQCILAEWLRTRRVAPAGGPGGRHDGYHRKRVKERRLPVLPLFLFTMCGGVEQQRRWLAETPLRVLVMAFRGFPALRG